MGTELTHPDDVESNDEYDAALLEYLHAFAESAQRTAVATEEIRDLRREANAREQEFFAEFGAIFEEISRVQGHE